jgi:hypothetical protein
VTILWTALHERELQPESQPAEPDQELVPGRHAGRLRTGHTRCHRADGQRATALARLRACDRRVPSYGFAGGAARDGHFGYTAGS